MTYTTSYKIAKSLYVSLGGDKNREFESVDDIYTAIDEIYKNDTGRINIEPIELSITENNTYEFNNQSVTGYKPVTIDVNIAQKYTDEQVIQLQTDARNEGYSDGETEGYKNGYTAGNTDGYSDGYADGLDDGVEEQKALLESITISENGTYTKEDGYNEVIVNVASSGGGSGFDFTIIGYSQQLTDELNSVTANDLAYSQEILRKWNAGEINGGNPQSAFKNDNKLVYAPSITITYNGGVFSKTSSMFNGCSNLKVVDNIIWTNADNTSTESMFYNCKSLTHIKLFDTSKCNAMTKMFYGCSSLTTIPPFDTSSAYYMYQMFNNCSSLTSIPQLDTSNVDSMLGMFSNCSSLTSIPQLDTSKVTRMSDMFNNCSSLTSIPQLDTSKVTDMSSMFYGCSSLTSIPQLDTSKVTDMRSMFYGCSKLQSIPLLDCSNLTSMSSMFGYSNVTSITELGGFKNLGMQKSLSGTNSYFLNMLPNLTYESVMNVINNLYDRKSAGYSVITIDMHYDQLAMLSDEEKAIATNKGWTLV